MANFWAKRISHDIDRINEVPKKWREQVREIIAPPEPEEEAEPESESEPEIEE